jgi:hypothetical protein
MLINRWHWGRLPLRKRARRLRFGPGMRNCFRRRTVACPRGAGAGAHALHFFQVVHVESAITAGANA